MKLSELRARLRQDPAAPKQTTKSAAESLSPIELSLTFYGVDLGLDDGTLPPLHHRCRSVAP